MISAFLIPNEYIPEEVKINEFSLSVDEVGSLANFDFFSSLPDDLEEKLESEVSTIAKEEVDPILVEYQILALFLIICFTINTAART